MLPIQTLSGQAPLIIAKVSKSTAIRDLAELLAKGCIKQLPGGGRSTRHITNTVS